MPDKLPITIQAHYKVLIKRIPRGFASGGHILPPEFQGRCHPAVAG